MMRAALTKPALAAEPSDPLLAAINLHRFAGEAYDDMPEDLTEEQESEAFRRLCSDPDAVLVAWNSPATSHEGALAALRLALQEINDDGEPIVKSLVTAALGYFEGRSAS
ncbi:hypothetical protein [Mesorhizobium sp. WSM3626]|uniref:hypothetical protein n=1 Tax=Mesorhizobium sp. WSM3626 TaxID=1040987 RepID=UPI0012EB648E|nr:hypothetical protein [Mesorhizobium sp. WSM3626]